ncbi:hypothetical protein B0H19DRAFT_569500 [Mycena capillaripes]|nr:hypothetical protein B0H19DRAFT_569500 [Mycena capillaripes]
MRPKETGSPPEVFSHSYREKGCVVECFSGLIIAIGTYLIGTYSNVDIWPEHVVESGPQGYCTLPDGPGNYTLPVNAASDEPVTECFVMPHTMAFVMGIPGFPKPLLQPKEPTFCVAESPGMGKGLFSTRTISQGEFIFSERPLLVAVKGMPVCIEDPKNFAPGQLIQIRKRRSGGCRWRWIACDRNAGRSS